MATVEQFLNAIMHDKSLNISATHKHVQHFIKQMQKVLIYV